MNAICEEYDLRLKNELVLGTCEWMNSKWQGYEERQVFNQYATSLSRENYTPKQNLIFRFSCLNSIETANMQVLEADLPHLDEEDIKELMIYYNIDKPTARYEEIKNEIAAPTSYKTRIPYGVIYELYKRGKVPFDKQIFAACLIHFNTRHLSHYSKELSPEAKERFDTIFPQDDFTLDVLMAVFEMEIGVDSGYYLEKAFNIGAVVIELVNSNKLRRATIQQKLFNSFDNPMLSQTSHGWVKNIYNDLDFSIDENIASIKLAENKKIPRAIIQQKLFDAFNNPTLKQTTHGWAKNIYRDLNFGVEENIACQEQLIQLMYSDRNLLVNFALQQLKKASGHKSFDWMLFIQSLDGIVYAEKLAGGLKTALGMLHKGLKKDPTLIELCCINLSPIFLQEDNKIQLAAIPCFELLETPNEATKEVLLPFTDTMHSDVKARLSHLIGSQELLTSNSYEVYKQEPYFPEGCTEVNRIKYIKNEDEFIFLLSKVLKGKDAMDYELFLEAILRYAYLKDTHLDSLLPALKQAQKIANQTYLDINHRIGVHHVLAAKLICLWLSPTPITMEMDIEQWYEKIKQEKSYTYSADRWQAVLNQFKHLSYLLNQLQKNDPLPLLSTPTHNNLQIDPSLFFERLNAYQTNKKTIDENDFCLALSRLNRWTPFDKGSLKNITEHDKVVAYLLNDSVAFDHTDIKQLNGSWLTAYALKNPEKSIDALIANSKKENWWTSSSPWNWKITKEVSREGDFSWKKLSLSFKKTNEQKPNASRFEHDLNNEEFIIADVHHWFCKSGFLQEPLFLNIVSKVFHLLDLEASETKSLLEVVKYHALHPTPLGKAGYFALALSLCCSKTTIRTAAFDWLSLFIEKKYLDLALFASSASSLIITDGHHIPLSRVAEQFDRLLQLQGVYTDILYHTIEASLLQLDTTDIPKSFNKVLHYYYEVLQLINQPIPENICAVLEEIKNTSAVKKEVKKLLHLSPNH